MDLMQRKKQQQRRPLALAGLQSPFGEEEANNPQPGLRLVWERRVQIR